MVLEAKMLMLVLQFVIDMLIGVFLQRLDPVEVVSPYTL